MKITPIQVPDEMRRQLGGRVVVHSILYSRSTIAPGLFDPEHERELAPVRQALVRANPVNGRKNIYIGSHAWYIEGMDPGESRRLLDDLLAGTTRPECVYQHRWRQWDLVMWDNRCVLHRGRPLGRTSAQARDAPHDDRRPGPDGRAPAGHPHDGVGGHHRPGRRGLGEWRVAWHDRRQQAFAGAITRQRVTAPGALDPPHRWEGRG